MPFRVRWANHERKLKKELQNFRENPHNFQNINKIKEGDFHLLKHFCENHENIDSLKWTILHNIGKVTSDPLGNLSKWEHAYINHFQTVFPKGLNSKD
jgi:hypothetical protein